MEPTPEPSWRLRPVNLLLFWAEKFPAAPHGRPLLDRGVSGFNVFNKKDERSRLAPSPQSRGEVPI